METVLYVLPMYTYLTTTPPLALCVANVSVVLDPSGNATISPTNIDGGSNDVCGIGNLALSLANFTCSHVGDNAVSLTVTDVHGNSAVCTSNVHVSDNTPPLALCVANVSVALDPSGFATISPSNIDGGSSDGCGISNLALSLYNFTCSHVGDNAVSLTVTDVNGNSAVCTSNVHVSDNTPPMALCVANVSVALDPSGNATISPTSVNAGSSDVCGIGNLALSLANFTCSHVGDNAVSLTVTDVHGNSAVCTSNVHVSDNTPPLALCVANVSVALDPSGFATISPTNIDGGSSDGCGISSLVLSLDNFTCSHVGDNEVILTVTDTHGNSSQCTTEVNVTDNGQPVALCFESFSIGLDNTGNATITIGDINDASYDVCGSISNMELSQYNFSCLNAGSNNVLLTVTDNSGNTGQCTSIVIVLDNTPPVAVCEPMSMSC